ncbi:Vacuolar protein sorting-associated protein 13C [Collichthys lucidus]|uniref:Vacuolar protein sorting-associated protein 13C n=1 Tax=Collichthys lucidus TaxID=240159 RepID=A0A4U5TU24_COLLU|nr:Vacuolar protein sorting-associated protein 13C [Collichthys lucidus]
MVFESVVSDLLNRFIGDYVENLDKSQLKIGIWGGNVVLENLKVKENALSEFDVPFKVKAGQIGKLTLKIPWKNLYNDAVVATLDGLYLLVVPGARPTVVNFSKSSVVAMMSPPFILVLILNLLLVLDLVLIRLFLIGIVFPGSYRMILGFLGAIKFDAAKEERYQQEAKQRELQTH